MAAEISPFVEANFGWPYGSSGWNDDMDANLVKFSYLFDRNIDGIVGSLPAIVNGKAYFLTLDNRLYFDVDGQRYSSPTPKWFVVTDRVSGQTYQFDGATLNAIDTPVVTDSRLDAVELVAQGLLNSSDVSKGDALIIVKQPFTGSVARTQHSKNSDILSALDSTAVGDGVSNDTAAFSAMDAAFAGRAIDLLGRTYLVDTYPIGNRYSNGFFKVGAVTFPASYSETIRELNGRVVMGDGALASLPLNYDVGPTGSVVAIGRNTLAAAMQVKQAVAIGTNAMSESVCSRDCIAIGIDALRYVTGFTPDYDQDHFEGTRDIAIGGNALRHVISGYSNIAIGRNAGQSVVNGNLSTIVGSGAVAGFAPIGLSGVIENWSPLNAGGGLVAVGYRALTRTIVDWNTAVGSLAGENLVKGTQNTITGTQAMQQAEVNSGFNGNVVTTATKAGSYAQSGNVLTLSIPTHGVSVGFTVGIRLLDGASQTFQGDVAPAVVLSVIDSNTYTINHPISRTASGTAAQYFSISLTAAPPASLNSAYGHRALGNMPWGQNNCSFGVDSLLQAADNVNGIFNTVAFGYRSGTGWTSPQNSTFIGTDAGRFTIAGAVNTGASLNITCIGYSTRVSGDNQVQLGNSATTTYVYGTVQNRSDIRDKADVSDTSLGLEFISSLRPVEGRWDMREDYVEIDEDGNIVQLEKDGSKKRQRLHQWFIAQEVKELCDKLGVEFGGYQDHSLGGGCDVLSLGYDEFIPPIVKAIKELNTKMSDMEARLLKLESAD